MLTEIRQNGAHTATLHHGWACPVCGQALGVLWQHTPLGLSPVAATPDGAPVTSCPSCGQALTVRELVPATW